jgi:hypothetical protein
MNAILLTIYNKEDSREGYEQTISWWLDNTKFDIYVVDSFGKAITISNRRLNVISFDQKDHKNDIVSLTNFHMRPTIGEMISIKVAYEYFKDNFKNYKYIIKVTGKYRLPDFQKALKIDNSNYDFIVQSRHKEYIQNTEILGFNASRFEKLHNLLEEEEGSLERKVSSVIKKHKNFFRLEEILIREEFKVSRNDGSILSSL